MNEKIKEYNQLVEEWNKRFGEYCEGIPVDPGDYEPDVTKRLQKAIFSDEMTEQQKINHTVTIIGDFANIHEYTPSKTNGKLTRNELATLIVQVGKDIELSNYSF